MMIAIPVDLLNGWFGDNKVSRTVVAIFLSPVILLYYGGLCVMVGMAWVVVVIGINLSKY